MGKETSVSKVDEAVAPYEEMEQNKEEQKQKTDTSEELSVQTSPAVQVPGLDIEQNPAFKSADQGNDAGVFDAYMEMCMRCLMYTVWMIPVRGNTI